MLHAKSMSCHPERNRAPRGEVEGSAVAFRLPVGAIQWAGSLILRCAIVAILCASASTALLYAKAPPALHVKTIQVHVTGVHPNPDDARDLIVSVQVTIRAADQPLVVPNCAESSTPPGFCMARLSHPNGKGIRVRKGLPAVLGVEPYEHWKPITVAPDAEQKIGFAYSTGLLDVKPDEPVRVSFEVWPNARSTKDWKSATVFQTPIFKNPSKAD
jgi:hypothetical protein